MALDSLTGASGFNSAQSIQSTDLSSGVGGVGGISGVAGATGQETGGVGSATGLDFRRLLDRAVVGNEAPGAAAIAPSGAARVAGAVEKLRFSNHAVERMRSRGISFRPEEMMDIENAVAKAARKGAKDTLVLSGGHALIVSVKNNTVVTVMDRQAMKDNVFTNIDSTVVI